MTDIYTDGDGGYASLKSGGPGMDFAVIHLKSQRGHGYHFTIDFYGQWAKFQLWKKSNPTLLMDLMSKSISAHKSCGSIDAILVFNMKSKYIFTLI